jgi:N-acetylglucosamine-6-sulfatase
MLKALVGVSLALALSAFGAPTGSTKARPSSNVILILLDDATVEDMQYMPAVQKLLVNEGTTFTFNYVPDPLCCPSRATILTGQYPHNHRVLDNVAPLGGASVFNDTNTIATYLNDDYRTGIFGKYFNDFDTLRYVPPGWDTWKVAVRGVYNYAHTTESINGKLHRFNTYMTNLYGSQARSFVSSAIRSGHPFFAYVPFVAPHVGTPHETADDPPSPYVAAKYRDSYAGPTLPDDPSVNEEDVSDKRLELQQLPLLTPEQIAVIRQQLAQRREALQSVDDQVRAMVNRVTRLGQADNTYFIFTSDNGYMQGQHRIGFGKKVAYEPSTRVPLVIRGPGITAGATYNKVTGLQDLTPTILSMTHQWHDQPLAQIDGISLLSLLNGQKTDRVQVIESAHSASLTDNQIAAGAEPTRRQARKLASVSWRWRGVVTSDRWKYVRYRTGEVEMYDLKADPYELENVYGKPGYQVEQARLRALYHKFKKCDAAECQ